MKYKLSSSFDILLKRVKSYLSKRTSIILTLLSEYLILVLILIGIGSLNQSTGSLHLPDVCYTLLKKLAAMLLNTEYN
jgi:cell division protein FtsX